MRVKSQSRLITTRIKTTDQHHATLSSEVIHRTQVRMLVRINKLSIGSKSTTSFSSAEAQFTLATLI